MALATGAARQRGRAEQARSRRSRALPSGQALRFVTLTVTTLALVVAGVVALLVVTGDNAAPPRAHHPRTPLPHLAAPVAHAVRWMSRELPHSASVAAPGPVVPVLRRDGFRRARTDARHATYVLGHPRGTAVPIARFGGARAVTVSEHVSVKNPAALRVAALQRQRSEGGQLLVDYAVHVAPRVQAVLAAGGLDLRAIRVVRLLAGNKPVTITAVHVDPAERAAGLPARIIDVRANAQAADSLFQLLPYEYRPATTQQLGHHEQRWVWSLQPLPIRGSGPR